MKKIIISIAILLISAQSFANFEVGKGPYVFISFQLNGVDFQKQVLPVIEKIAHQHPGEILVDAFAKRDFLESKGFSTEVVDSLENNFEKRLNFVNEGGIGSDAERRKLVDFAARARQAGSKVTVYTIGEVTAGVETEVKMFQEVGIKPSTLPIMSNHLVFISFQTKNQVFATDIKPVVLDIIAEHKNSTFLDAFATHEFLESKGISTEVVDTLRDNIKNRLNIVNKAGIGTDNERRIMAELAAENKKNGGTSTVYVIGDPIEGVKDEAKLYKEAGIDIVYKKNARGFLNKKKYQAKRVGRAIKNSLGNAKAKVSIQKAIGRAKK